MAYAPVPPADRARHGLARGVLTVLAGVALAHTAQADAPVPDWPLVAALFQQRCVMCHSTDAAARGLRLDTYANAIAGGENGPVLVPGDPSSSELFRRLLGTSQPRMPFLSRPLAPEDIDLIQRWIAGGLPE